MKKYLAIIALALISFIYQVWILEKSTVYVYKDDGVGDESLIHIESMIENSLDSKYKLKTINAYGVKQGFWIEDAALFVIPGGMDLPYVKKLNGLGNLQIKRYVEGGGSFLGICAGAYYSSAYVEFDRGGPLEVLGNRELSFFPGKASGPVFGPYNYQTNSGSRAIRILTIFRDIPEAIVYYNGGCYFEGVEKNSTLIATYDNELPAIVSIKNGRGNALLSCVHFEYDPALLDSNDLYIQKIINPLAQSDNLRNALLKKLLETLKISCKK